MKAQLLKYLDRISSSFWFLPSLMAAAAVCLAFVMVAADESVAEGAMKMPDWAYAGSAQGASAVLQTIAGSMITIAGVVFSLTLVALSLASSQFGPRLLRNFMRDNTNQMVLGTFVATFLYCLLVLRAIRHGVDDAFVPHLSVTLGVAFALASLWVLIFFIHHVSVSIQADDIVARIVKEMDRGIGRLFPSEIGQAADPDDRASDDDPESLLRGTPAPVEAIGDGYLQIVNADQLMEIAGREDLQIQIMNRPGQYVVEGSCLVRVWCEHGIASSLEDDVRSAFVLGSERTPAQDFEYSIHQLVEVAVRALSPGVNDPFTAIRCIDRLGSGLSRLARREMPSMLRLDQDMKLRVLTPQTRFADLVDASFDQIRQNARANAAVSIRLLEMITVIAEAATRADDLRALKKQAEMVANGAKDALPEANDRAAASERYRACCEVLGEEV
tara:strand:- start:9382 stop:10713 length:1332 start_codon:yes stop_codon:yes gene_type:complete